jgi:hypothetical protein
LAELVLEAAQAAIPAGLLASLKIGQLQRAKTPTSGSAGALQKNALRGGQSVHAKASRAPANASMCLKR